MKRVYVETNFLVDLLRPLRQRPAQRLWQRHTSADIRLTVPWCSLKEAQRTLQRIVRQDLGFAETAGLFRGRLFANNAELARRLGPAVDEFLDEARKARGDAEATLLQSLEQVRTQVDVVHASERTAELAVTLNREKYLKPFDEMVLACVLADAEERPADEDRFFCSLDKDLAPTDDNGLVAEYKRCAVVHRRDFKVP